MAGEEFVIEGEQPDAPAAPAGDTGRPSVPAGYVPHHVVGELRRQLREREDALKGWTALGKSPAEVKAEQERLRQLSGGRSFTTEEAKAIAAQMAEADPEYAEFRKSYRAESQAKRELTATAGEAKVAKWLKDAGTPEDQMEVASEILQNAILGVVTHPKNKEMLKRLYFGHDVSVYDDAFAIVKKQLGLGAAKRQEAAAIQAKKTPARVTPTPPPNGNGPPPKPKTEREQWADSHNQAHALLASMDEAGE